MAQLEIGACPSVRSRLTEECRHIDGSRTQCFVGREPRCYEQLELLMSGVAGDRGPERVGG